ncbi:Agenet-like domain [Dillenia turbinata]|uniref:Agenet-like domain n=1 Tax=Dillenia turbinata TaxID=194707 RepID=A0AAN8UP22_9MAGN
MGLFRKGDLVEVCSKEEGFVGSYYAAVVVAEVGNNSYIVEYKTLVTDDETRPLREIVSACEVRPNPPEIKAKGYSILEKVDAYDNDGWWVGKITGRTESGYYVYFKTTGDEILYPFSRLRLHQEWFDATWVVSNSSKKKVSKDVSVDARSTKKTKGSMTQTRTRTRTRTGRSGMGYIKRGDLVEVCSAEGFVGSYYYYAAVVVEEVENKGGVEYLVEYKNVLREDKTLPLREVVSAKRVRPYPPEIPAKNFSFLEAVDAFYKNGWWVGQITEITESGYYVYFDETRDEVLHSISQLRVHQEWFDGEWTSANKRVREVLWKPRVKKNTKMMTLLT